MQSSVFSSPALLQKMKNSQSGQFIVVQMGGIDPSKYGRGGV